MSSENHYEKIFSDAKSFYFSIGAIRCPALNGEFVYFNRRGFQHLIRKGKRYRSLTEIIRRLRLLPLAVQTIKTTKIHHEETTILGEESIATFWTLKETYAKQNIVIYIIIRKLNDGKIHFFSVYDK